MTKLYAGRQVPIFQENSYFFLFLVMIMYFKSLNVVDHMEND